MVGTFSLSKISFEFYYCNDVFVLLKSVFEKLCSGTHHGGFQFLLILDLWGMSFHALVVFGSGKNLLFKSILAHCDTSINFQFQKLNFLTFFLGMGVSKADLLKKFAP